MASQVLETIFNHLVLPPKLPTCRDGNIQLIEERLSSRLLRACVDLRNHLPSNAQRALLDLEQALEICSLVNRGRLEVDTVKHALKNLQPGSLLALHVHEQNAAILVRQAPSTAIIFEVFEASPLARDVLAAEDALQWDMPGRAVEIPRKEFMDKTFQDSLAALLQKASLESLSRFAARATKANRSVVEHRDTSDPALITQMLMTLLEAIGSSIDTPKFRKRVRDDVIIHTSELPWRRSPFWLVLRVTARRLLGLKLGDEAGRLYYKFLMCNVMSQLMEDSKGLLPPESIITLRAKLCRRLAKLEGERAHSQPPMRDLYDILFTSMAPLFHFNITGINEEMTKIWESHKKKITRCIPQLHFRASPQSLRLALPNSSAYLHGLLRAPGAALSQTPSLDLPPLNDWTTKQVIKFAERYFELAKTDVIAETHDRTMPATDSLREKRCGELAELITHLFQAVTDSYASNPEQLSMFILNLFDVWVTMDKCAVALCPLLKHYHPLFTPKALDVLQLPKLRDMERLHKIQSYIDARCRDARVSFSIFADPSPSSFAHHYFELYGGELHELYDEIQEDSATTRQQKVTELEGRRDEYNDHSRAFTSGTCLCSVTKNGERDVSGCTKCWHRRRMNKMKIEVHENFLPDDAPSTSAVLLELAMPEYLGTYRDATWKIFNNLRPSAGITTETQPPMLLEQYSQLRSYANASRRCLSLASTTKSFLQTHYKGMRMMVDLEEILLPNALTFKYFDTAKRLWIDDLTQPLTLHHLCRIHVPPSVAAISTSRKYGGPTSNEVVASQTKCPTSMSVHEFTANQRLLSGYAIRWPTILIELGASNVNFSSEDTMLMISHLATQAGPNEFGNDLLRDSHAVFQEQGFCMRLIEQIGRHLSTIATNWRESNCMETLITLILRLCELVPRSDMITFKRAVTVLQKACTIARQWVTILRHEVRNATDATTAERSAKYGFRAALLCRRAFTIFTGRLKMSTKDLSVFVDASVALQENLVVDLENVSSTLKNMLIRDVKMVHRLEKIIQDTVRAHPETLWHAIQRTLIQSDDPSSRMYSSVTFLPTPHAGWVRFVVDQTNDTARQVFHYHYLEGHLLIDGKPLGRLPLEIRDSSAVKELFGNQHLITFSSSLSGMMFQLATSPKFHQIHFGTRNGRVVVRDMTSNGLLEYVPRDVFRGESSFDLPNSLVDDCVHWINLHQRKVLIRRIRKPEDVWRVFKPHEWTLDLQTHEVSHKKSLLVDPRSDTFKQVENIFRDFERAAMITVLQPHSAEMCVQLKGLELSFFVNKRSGLLQCREFKAEIDPNQNAGTLYGLDSKLILRDVLNNQQRSLLVPLGNIVFARRGLHVAVKAENTGTYARFMIDDVLGRLTCAPEPLLLYYKAQFHAYTSFPLPDPLTGRTGSEEAFHCLESSLSQPWQPLNTRQLQILGSIKQLSPTREYYPREHRILQEVFWNPYLTSSIQHDGYHLIVNRIMATSERLRPFFPPTKDEVYVEDITHLRRRGQKQRQLYAALHGSNETGARQDRVYKPRDRQVDMLQADNVHQTALMLNLESLGLDFDDSLVDRLAGWQFIGGFGEPSQDASTTLSDLIDGPIAENWGTLVEMCRSSVSHDRYKIMFRLALLAFSATPDMASVKLLAAFAVLDELKLLQPPQHAIFERFEPRPAPTVDSLLSLIAAGYPKRFIRTAGLKGTERNKQETHEQRCVNDGRKLASFLIQQWPAGEPSITEFEPDVLEVDAAMEGVFLEWKRLMDNKDLYEYVCRIQEVLGRYVGAQLPSRSARPSSTQTTYVVASLGMSPAARLSDLLANQGPIRLSLVDIVESKWSLQAVEKHEMATGPSSLATNPIRTDEIHELQDIISAFTTSSDPLRSRYGNDLQVSLESLKTVISHDTSDVSPPSVSTVRHELVKVRQYLYVQQKRIRKSLFFNDGSQGWLDLGNQSPRTTVISLLEQLRSTLDISFGQGMKEAIVDFGVALTASQRLLRMLDAHARHDYTKFRDEARNHGHTTWAPLDYPDWLLLEIDNNILVREEQVEVAHATISPTSGQNSVLQMNMGKGKTSCIMPMVAAVLADETQLCRLVVPKSLLFQTAQTLQSRLGGLVGRKIRHIPFSRRTPTNSDQIQLYWDLHAEILESSGIILALPEHIMSFELSGQQRLADSRYKEAGEMTKVQKWLESTARDVLDESDFTLAVKTQLIYPSGGQDPVDGHPQRWETVQGLLSLVEHHIKDLQRDFAGGIKVVSRAAGFPMMHFVQKHVEDALQDRIISDICSGSTPFLRLTDIGPELRDEETRRVFMEPIIERKTINRVARFFADRDLARNIILHIRGVLVNRILLLCLKKRWNVKYGLHPDRDPIAVPFEAKGVPSEQAEFGHPDVAIILTCLAFYYSGLTPEQLREDLQHVLKSDDPAAEYDRWIHNSASLPEPLRHWNVINADDDGQVRLLWNHLRADRMVVNHYMNNFVFPRHARQFRVKLQLSGWDIPYFSHVKSPIEGTPLSRARTTGFSGTNDNRMLLPLTIKQDDLPSLSQTNAEVLTYLLKNMNRRYKVVQDAMGRRLSEQEFVQSLADMKIRVLIDAGAYVMEMNNQALVSAWLDQDTQAKGAVYFGPDNRAWVKFRNRKDPIPLVASPFADNLDQCLVYIDEAHTRGTDLKLPLNAHGALTLALGQTKDHTVQAAMRLRQLRTTQSLTFFAPPEVNQSILDYRKKKNGSTVDSGDVVRWLLEQTCQGNEQLQHLYLAQGVDFCRRKNAAFENPQFLNVEKQRTNYLSVIRQPEQQSLLQLYGGRDEEDQSKPLQLCSKKLQVFMKELDKKRADAAGASSAIRSSLLEEVEQEREVEFQVEEQREAQVQTHFRALVFGGIHPAIVAFAVDGVLEDNEGYCHAFTAISQTSLGVKFDVGSTGSRLFVSTEVMRTVAYGKAGSNNNFLRPVEWLLYSPMTETALIIVPEEAESLIHTLRFVENPKTHLVAYAAATTKSMVIFNRLQYYSIPQLPPNIVPPAHLMIELGIFAGRLYFDFAELEDVLAYFKGNSATPVLDQLDGAMDTRVFTSSPYSFMLEWLAARRNGQDIAHTPIGYVCHGRQLHPQHPFFVDAQEGIANTPAPLIIPVAEEDDESQSDGDSDDGDDDDDFADSWDRAGEA